jgi:hypothetical protein
MKRIITTLSQKWPEYLIEAIVIVASILGAYALDNWNENRIDRNKELQILSQLTEDYESNLAQLEQKIALRNLIIQASQSILNAIDNPQTINRDSLLVHLSYLIIDPTFDPIDNDLIYSGNIRLLSDKKLKRLLSSWSSDIIAVKEVEILWRQATNLEYRPFLIKVGLSRDVYDIFWKKVNHDKWLLEKGFVSEVSIGKSNIAPDTMEILSYKELEGYASLSITLNLAANQESIALKKHINEIIKLLKQE